ncbi:MCE family protein [Mycobacterium vicinigordonae]|uniref:MCE family protein n=1 Tax=Mycobacterium vicinigordonae TaxID=1719132 RepID=A0A7D6DXT0_9MYCO|nr:MlaD family protein [Mycobacterium vicinigordonae]QLL06369.1 MCE family protein [Mycobacterium vicinigordonae]
MNLTRRIRIQLAVFAAITLLAGAVMVFDYMQLPGRWFGIGRYQVILELPESAGLYKSSNVTYRGTEVGRVIAVRLTESGVAATLSLRSDIGIPANLTAEVHSQSAIGEQFVALLPRGVGGPDLKDGDVIPRSRTTIPPDINTLLDATNVGLQAIPRDNLRVAVDEAAIAVGGLGAEISRIVRGSTTLSIDAEHHLDEMTALIDRSKPVLDTQNDTSDAIQGWARHLATITGELRDRNADVAGILQTGPAAATAGQQLIDRLNVSLPVVLANLVSVGQVAVTYRDSVEQLLVLFPLGTQIMQGISTANRDTKQPYRGAFLDFNLNINLPPPCTTGFLPPQQIRTPSNVDFPDAPAGDLYCRIPQDAMFNVRGARNLPCVTRPGKRAPTVKMCESDEQYVPLNEGYNWKGDPNATYTGQAVPQQPGSTAPPAQPPPQASPPPIAAVEYDPATGTYIGPDGQMYTRSDLAGTPKDQTWQSMLLPPTR